MYLTSDGKLLLNPTRGRLLTVSQKPSKLVFVITAT